jgi:hypothetical protein
VFPGDAVWALRGCPWGPSCFLHVGVLDNVFILHLHGTGVICPLVWKMQNADFKYFVRKKFGFRALEDFWAHSIANQLQ